MVRSVDVTVVPADPGRALVGASITLDGYGGPSGYVPTAVVGHDAPAVRRHPHL